MQLDQIKRRAFISLLGGAAAAWPMAARAQQAERMRRLGMLFGQTQEDPVSVARVTEFHQALQQLGWTEGHNLRIDIRWSADNADETRKYAAELVGLAPDVILSSGTIAAAALQQATRTVPIVFTLVADPVGGGMVDSLARPGGNATGFTSLEYGLSSPPASANLAPSRTRRPRSAWKSARSTCATPARSNEPSPPSRGRQMVAWS